MIEQLGELIASSRRIVAFTGAGISTESGIPDFRGPQGVWTKLDPSDFTLERYIGSSEHRARIWRARLERQQQHHEPNAGHHAIAELETMGILDCVITQNIDGLHQEAGSTVVLELHGSPRTVRCLACRARTPADETYERVRRGESDPKCLRCGGILKSGTILFNEPMPLDVVDDAYARAQNADLCLVIGSSLVVYPAAGIPMEAVRYGARLAIVNAEPTPLDGAADVVVRGRAGDVLPKAVEFARARAHS
ncbi:MAG: NAD-dependent deacetylase [Actinomycetota bacterium]